MGAPNAAATPAAAPADTKSLLSLRIKTNKQKKNTSLTQQYKPIMFDQQQSSILGGLEAFSAYATM